MTLKTMKRSAKTRQKTPGRKRAAKRVESGAKAKARKSGTKMRSASTAPDKPNVPRLKLVMTGVEGGGAERMSFSASAGIGRAIHFGEDSPERVLYDGPYVPGPYEISLEARELDPTSDDVFQTSAAVLAIDMNSLQGNAAAGATLAEPDEDEDESAAYTVFFTGQITPAIEITNVDIANREITFDLLPENLDSGNFQAVFSSKKVDADPKLDDVTVVSQQVGGGRGQKLQFDWNTFAGKNFSTPFHSQSLNIYWNNLSSSAQDTWRDLSFIGYGVFRISRFITPDDGQFGGPTEQATFGSTKRVVHSSWISRVRCEEGKGVSQGDIVQILGPGRPNADKTVWIHKSGTQRLVLGNEGSFGIARLTINKSLAKHKSDRRFRAHDTILLSTEPGTLFAIEDEGNWTDDPPGPHNHLDRYDGFGGPARLHDFPSAYVVKP
jgi:hypothetical protein